MLSKRLSEINLSHIRGAFERASSMPEALDLSIGYPEDYTPDYIKEAGIAAIQQNFTRYTPVNGIAELRLAVARKLTEENSVDVQPAQVFITPGVSTGIALCYLALLDPGDEVLVPDPYFPPYRDLALMIGAKPILIDTYPSFQLTADLLERNITKRTKVLVINSPNNPSGAVYPETELRKIAQVANRHNLTVISDEIYEYFCYDIPHFSIGSIYPRTLTLNGFSKAYAMTGWRIGYIGGPEDLIKGISSVGQNIVFSSSSISQQAALAAVGQNPKELNGKYKTKRDNAKKALRDFNIAGAQGAFYMFLKLPEGVDDLSFTETMADLGVLILPSRAFSRHEDYFRLSYASNDQDVGEGLSLVRKALLKIRSSK